MVNRFIQPTLVEVDLGRYGKRVHSSTYPSEASIPR
jgi:hypothetical protein